MKPSGIPQKPYEDQLCDYCPVRKPGYISPRDKEEQQRQAFVSDLISALQHATDARAGRDDKARARDAYTQLQYDFPVHHRYMDVDLGVHTAPHRMWPWTTLQPFTERLPGPLRQTLHCATSQPLPSSPTLQLAQKPKV